MLKSILKRLGQNPLLVEMACHHSREWPWHQGMLTTSRPWPTLCSMATAKFSLPDGTSVTVEGSTEEIGRVMEMYRARSGPRDSGPVSQPQVRAPRKPSAAQQSDQDFVPLIVNQIKSSESAEAIEKKILDERSQLNRILLPLYVVQTEMENRYGLTSGEIAKITRELGVPVGQPDVSKILAGDGLRYVLGDAARVRGKPVRYKLSPRGVRYVSEILGGAKEDEGA